MSFRVMYNVILFLGFFITHFFSGSTFLLLVSSYAVEYNGECKTGWPLTPRPRSVSVSEFGAVGDGRTLNTIAFQNAIFYLKSFVDKGGAQLYVPEGRITVTGVSLDQCLLMVETLMYLVDIAA